jgi:ligand-binding sensor domain-containing protein/DNA-binding NarL/FixJ family response regulator/signal transduction histidine kinase
MDKRIRVLCVDDHQIVREGIVAIIGRQVDMEVTGVAVNGLQAVEGFLQHRPDVTLMDLQLPVLSGLEAIRRIRSADAHAKIIVLTTYHGDEDVHQALVAGAATYLLKEAALDDLAGVVRAVHNGARPLSDDVLRILATRSNYAQLSAREVEVIELIAQGLRNKDVGKAMGVTEETIKVHVRHIMNKLNVQDRTEAVTVAMRRGIIHLLLLCALMAGVAVAAEARSPAPPYVWRSWTRLDGLPGSQVWAITQDHTGYIWLGTNEGLVRFDGVRFVSGRQLGFDRMPNASVRALSVASDGSLWIGFSTGGVSHIRGRLLRNFTAQDGLPQGLISGVIQDRRGDVWASSVSGLYRLHLGRWQRVNLAAGLTAQTVGAAYEDRHGRLWVGTPQGVYRSTSAAPLSFERVTTIRAQSFAEDAAGQVWSTSDDITLALLSGDSPRAMLETERYAAARRLIADPEGRLWIATLGDGLLRVNPRGGTSVDRFGGPGVLSSDVLRTVFQDREGNIWLGTPRGLDRGSPGSIRTVPEPSDGMGTLVQAVATASDGSVWAGTDSGLYRFARGARDDVGRNAGLPSQTIVALHGDGMGRMWVATDRGIGRIDNGRFLPLIPVGTSLIRPVALTTDRNGRLWLYDLERGLVTWDGKTLARVPKGEHGKRAAFSVMGDSKGRIWTGLADGTIVVHEGNRSRLYTAADGLPAGLVSAFYEDDAGTIWAGSVRGLMRFRNGRFDAITWQSGLPGNIVTAITGDKGGHLWLGVSAGIVRVSPSDFDEVVNGRATALPHVLYDGSDGLRGDPVPKNTPAVTRGGDGRLWFVTSDGVAVVSPESHTKNRVAPPVVIETVAADQRPIASESDGRLPPRTANLQIDYTALSFVAPEKIRFSYLMEGFDADWVDAGTRRQAFYTNLPPGDYRFRVRASNDGVPSEREAVWAFTLAPAFYQTRWFAAVVAVLMLTGGALAWRARVHQVRGRFSAILVERTRVAREVHDTLLQSLLGVLFRLDEVANVVDVSSESAKEQLVRLRRQVEFYIREARYSIRDLRSPILQSRGLATAMRAVGEGLTSERAVAFHLDVEGSPRGDLQRIDEHLLRIGQEAITNAVRHGQAATVGVELRYHPESVALRVRDDGKSFDTGLTIVSDGVHWGLKTMRERAEQIGGALRIESAEGHGTVVEVIVPVPRASQP